MTIKVTADELAQFSEGDTTLAFKDGSGYIAEMAAYHELHCIVSLTPSQAVSYYDSLL